MTRDPELKLVGWQFFQDHRSKLNGLQAWKLDCV